MRTQMDIYKVLSYRFSSVCAFLKTTKLTRIQFGERKIGRKKDKK